MTLGNEIYIAAAQFEAGDGLKARNLENIDWLTTEAVSRGARLVCFHECSITGYTYLERLTRDDMAAVAEPVPYGPSVTALIALAKRHSVYVGAGLVERDGDLFYNCYVVAGPEGVVARHRKLHAFVSPFLSCGSEYTVFDALGWRFGILTCYDNNLPENARITAMMGAEVILAPHVTGCLPSPAPGRGTVDREIWDRRLTDPVPCRMEFDGPKGRGWLMKWLPARAWENGVYYVYSNVIGVDGGTVKPGGSMILDPFGEVVTECRSLDDEVVVAALVRENLRQASGASYIRARRPELYGKMVEPNLQLSADRRPEVWWQRNRSERPS